MTAMAAAIIVGVASCAIAIEVSEPQGGDDHAWMTYASLVVLPDEDLTWLEPLL